MRPWCIKRARFQVMQSAQIGSEMSSDSEIEEEANDDYTPISNVLGSTGFTIGEGSTKKKDVRKHRILKARSRKREDKLPQKDPQPRQLQDTGGP